MARQLVAVRVRAVPVWIAQAGVVCWCGPVGLEVPGYRKIWGYSGPSKDGVGTINLTFVQPRSTVPVNDRFVDDLRAWALAWFSDVGSCI